MEATGGALKPENYYWYNISYVFGRKGTWEYASNVNQDLYDPLPEGSRAKIKHLQVTPQEKMLGTNAYPKGDDSKHLDKRVVKRIS